MSQRLRPARPEIRFDSRLWRGEDFDGTYVVYEATPNGVHGFVCDVNIHSLHETTVEDTRVARLSSMRTKPADVPPSNLNEELAVIFGPGLSAQDAVRALRKLAQNIEKSGLLIGREEEAGDFSVEQLDGTVVR